MKKLVIAVVFLFATSISAGELTEKQKPSKAKQYANGQKN